MRAKILFILHHHPPIHGAAIVGGYIKKSKIINSEFECHYINLGTSSSIDEIGKGSFIKLLNYMSIIWQVTKQLFTFRPDICYMTINSKGAGFYKDVVIVFLVKLFGKRTVYHFHNKGVADNHHRFVDNLLYRFTFRNSYIILLSPLLHPDIEKYVPSGRVFYCANGIPVDNRSSVDKREKNKVPHLLFLSNMMKEKGVFDLLDACKILKLKGGNFICDFAGKWMDISENEFNIKVSTLGLSDFVFYQGPKYETEKNDLFNSRDIFVLPTHNDCFPLVLLEAMQHGLPVIASREGANSEIITENVTGLLSEKHNPNDLAAKIEVLLTNDTLRKRMGKAGQKKFNEKYTLELFEQRFFSIIEQLVNEDLRKH